MRVKKRKTQRVQQNQHIITRDIRVGSNQAEQDDSFLFECFVKNNALQEALDPELNGMILAGRTGSGKSAIIRYIQRYKYNVEIPPSELAMHYISNSDIIRFLNDIGADLSLLFQSIWKHVILIEYIKARYKISDVANSNFFSRLLNSFGADKKKKRALDYLEKYSNQFWVDLDENVRSITSSYEKSITSELGY